MSRQNPSPPPTPEPFCDPRTPAVALQPTEAASFDDHQTPVSIQSDPVAVPEAVSHCADVSVSAESQDPSSGRLGRGELAGIGDVHRAIERDGEIVGRLESVFNQIPNRPARIDPLQSRCGVPDRKVVREQVRRDLRVVDTPVLGNEHATVSTQGRAVGAAPRVGKHVLLAAVGIDPPQQAVAHARAYQVAKVGAPHRALAETHATDNDLSGWHQCQAR